MANKRQQKKSLRQELRGVLLSSGYSKKDVNKLSVKELEKLSKPIIQEKEVQKQRDAYISFWEEPEVKKEQQKILKRASAKKLHREKVYALEKLGIPREFLSEYQTRKIKMQDIKDGKVNRYTHPDLFPHSRLNEVQIRFNYDTVYKARPTKDGARAWYFAFLDMTGEVDLENLMYQASLKTPKELIQAIVNLLKTPPSYKRGKSASSGKAGIYRYRFTTVDVLKTFHAETRQYTRHYKRLDNLKKKRRIHTGNNARSYQVIWNTAKGCNYFEELSVRAMLEISWVFMDNVTEHERFSFYKDFYADLIKYLELTKEERAKLMKVLPRPDIGVE